MFPVGESPEAAVPWELEMEFQLLLGTLPQTDQVEDDPAAAVQPVEIPPISAFRVLVSGSPQIRWGHGIQPRSITVCCPRRTVLC